MSSLAISGQGSGVSREVTALARRQSSNEEQGPKGLHGLTPDSHVSCLVPASPAQVKDQGLS